MIHVIVGNVIGDEIRDQLSETVEQLGDEGVTPGLATVLMNSDGGSETYVSMKQRDCGGLESMGST